MHYGVQKLVAINSGKYLFAEIDLSKPVHLVAANNRGKSTLVNTLQFLYVDEFDKMRFGKRSLEDTRRHYFGSDKSYLVFECQTPAGIQCMLVRGLSNLNGARFERFVYDGVFQAADFIAEGGQIRDFQSVRTALADRHLSKVNTTDLWRVLSASVTADTSSVPRLNILPIRKHEEYNAFRDVFARLLSLSAADVRTLKNLIIEAHARDIVECRIDIALEYRKEYEAVERSERELRFIQSIAAEIDHGQRIRLQIEALSDKITAAAPTASLDAWRGHAYLTAEEQRLTAEAADITAARAELDAQKDVSTEALGIVKATQSQIKRERDALQSAHEKWGQYSAQHISQMRINERQKNVEIVELEQHLAHTPGLDLKALRRRAAELEQRITANRTAYANWTHTAAAELIRAGITEVELESAFRVARPELLTLIVGKTLTIKDLDSLCERIRKLAARVKNGKYSDDVLKADLAGISLPAASLWRDLEQLGRDIALDEQDLRQQKTRLDVATNEHRSQTTLAKLRDEFHELQQQLSEYDTYASAWSKRNELDERQRTAADEMTRINKKIAEFKRQLTANTDSAQTLATELQALAALKQPLATAATQFHECLRRLYMEVPTPTPTEIVVGDIPTPLAPHVQATTKTLRSLKTDATSIEELRQQLLTLQDRIRDASLACQAQACYFGEAAEEWRRLIESRESLVERQSANEKNWDALFKTLGARLNGIVTAFRNIKLAVEGINRGLKTYQVSNLRAVEIHAEEVHDLYSDLESLTSAEGLFQDREAVDDAKRGLRRMIESEKVIELNSLFDLKIRAQLADGKWRQADSLDEIGSTGTGMTTKAMIFIQLVRAIANDERYRLHFYIDGVGELDDDNLSVTAEMAVSKGIIPITADPRLHFEPLAHPEVTVYSLGEDVNNRFFIDSYRTYHARRTGVQAAQSATSHE